MMDGKNFHGLTEELSLNLPGGTEENDKASLSIAGVSTKIRTNSFSNTSVEHYHRPKMYFYLGLSGVYPHLTPAHSVVLVELYV